MATRDPLRPIASLMRRHALGTPRPAAHRPSRRTFLNALLQPDRPLAISVTRTLPYPREKLYDLIADVDSYAQFLPYCQHSRVTAWSRPDDSDGGAPPAGPRRGGRRWPVEGELTVGFGPVTQSYTSRIVCVPGRSVEALSGRDEPAARRDGGGNPFRTLVTRWTVEDAPAAAGAARGGGWTRVGLDLSMRLEDPLVHVMLSRVVDESAAKMIDAFERRARQLFGPPR